MGKKADEVNSIFEQNRLLKEQNELLRQLLNGGGLHSNNMQVFVKDIDKDEMRSGFLVTTHRKRLWNVQIGLINEFARICKKHNLRWFAYGGTLLGAARHKGFIPWDDDVDLAMLRPDYEKFNAVAPAEIKPPYYFDAWYNYRLEGEPQSDSEADLPLLTIDQQKNNFVGAFPSFPLIKIRDSRTTMIEFNNRKNVHQGIWIDIFPLDPVPPFFDNNRQSKFNAALDMLMATFVANQVRSVLKDGHKFSIDADSIKDFMNQSYKQRARNFEAFLAANFDNPNYIGQFRLFCFNTKKHVYNTKDFQDITRLPFEEIDLPVPIDFNIRRLAQNGDGSHSRR